MKAISLHEPYASLIMWGWKTIETRTHPRFAGLVNQTIIIHATKNRLFVKDPDTIVEILNYLHTVQKQFFVNYLNSDYFDKTFGKLLGTVLVTDFGALNHSHSKKALIDCSKNNRFGIILEDPKQFKTPKLYRGHQGIFNVVIETMPGLEYLKPRKDL